MPTKIITVHNTSGVPAESTGADINKGAPLNSVEFDQNLVNLRAAIDRKADLSGGASFSGTILLPSTTTIGNVSPTELATLDGITATTAELNTLYGITATTSELNVLHGITAGTAELNRCAGLTSAAQTQINSKAPSDSPYLTGAPSVPTIKIRSDSPSNDPNTLDYYVEGTWTPTDGSGAGLTLTGSNCKYTRVGNVLHIVGVVQYPIIFNPTIASIVTGINIPYWVSVGVGFTATNRLSYTIVGASPGALTMYYGGAIAVNSNFSGKSLYISLTTLL